MITEQARSDVYLNGQQAGQELEKLATKALKLKKEMLEMRKANDKAGFDKKEKELRGVNKEMKNLQKQAFDVNNVLKNLKSSSLNDLYKAQRALNREMRKLPQNSKEYKEMERDAQKLDKQINKVKNSTKSVSSPLQNIKKLLGGIAVLAVFKQLITNIVRVRSEFQKYEAVLTNALGSQQASNLAMKNLTNFAEKTPFQLNELTNSYVKLVNQGFKPSITEMTKLGDVAATQGKGFDQLAEAIIDAQTGEFERLKEFGIRASKEGDKVTFTFRGMEEQVDFTARSIQDYILGLGEMEGVTGSMAGISETLGGRISNLRDSWTTLLNSMGENSTGIMVNVVNWMIDIVNTIDEATKRMRRFKMEYLEKNVSDHAALSIAQIESLIRAGMNAGESYGQARLHAMNLYYATEQDAIDERLRQANAAREADDIKLAEKHEYEALMYQKSLDVIKKHYEDEDKLRKKQAEEYQIALKKQEEVRLIELEKENKKKAKLASESQKEIYDSELTALHKQYLAKQLTQEQYEQELLALKMANLEAEMLIRQQFNMDYADLEEELFNLRVGYMEKTQQERDRLNEEERKALELKDQEEKQRRDQDLRDYEQEMLRKIQAAQAFSSDIVTTIAGEFNERKQAEIEYNNAIAELQEEYKSGKMEKEQYEEQLSDLSRERKKEEVELEKKRGKAVLLALLDYLRKYAYAKIAEVSMGSFATGQSIATAGIAGAAQAAVLTALVEGAFQLVKSKITQNYEGRFPVIGAMDNRTYMAENRGMAVTGLYTSPSLVAERGSEMIIDNPTLNNISMNRPDIIQDIISLRVPQYASGRVPETVQPSMTGSFGGQDAANFLKTIIKQNSDLLRALRSGQVKAVVGDYQVRELRNRMDKINSIEKSISK